MKIKLTYIVTSLMKCGPMNMLYTLVSNIDRELFDVTIITLKPEPDNSLQSKFEELGIPIYKIGNTNSHVLFGLKRRVVETVEQIGSDIVHAHGMWPDYYSGYIKHVPTVVSVHNKLKEDYVPLYGCLMGAGITELDAYSMRRTSLAISVSNSVAAIAESKYGIQSKVVINGVDTVQFASVSDVVRGQLREKLHIGQGSYVFLHIGNMIVRKNPFLLAKAFCLAYKKNPTIELHFLGDGPLLIDCKKQFANQKGIVFHGNVDNVDEYMKAADCMVSATASDGMSMATLEGLACGLRGVMSDIDVHREIKDTFITEKQDFVIVGEDPAQYAQGFIAMSSHPGVKNNVNKELLSGKRMAQQYMEQYFMLFDKVHGIKK